MEQHYLNSQNARNWVEQIASQSILIISVFIATYLFVNKDLYDAGFSISVGFWSNFFFNYVCKIRSKANFFQEDQIKKDFLVIDISLLLVSYIIIIPLFIAYNILLDEKIQSLSIMTLFTQLSFYICALFSFIKNDSVKQIINMIHNNNLKLTAKIIYYLYSFLLILFFVLNNDQQNTHHKFIYSSFTVSLIFMGIFRLFNLKNLGKFFQIIFSSTVVIISWKQTQNGDNEEIIQSAYGFLLVKQIATLFLYACQFLQILFSDQDYCELPVQQQSSQTDNAQVLRDMFSSNATYDFIVQTYLQQLAQRIVEEKQKHVLQQLTQEYLEKVIPTISYDQKILFINPQDPSIEQASNSETASQEINNQQEQPKECPICSEEYKNNEKIFQLKCNHEFHAACLTQWIKCKNNCPLCRNEVLSIQQIEQLSYPKVVEKVTELEDIITN